MGSKWSVSQLISPTSDAICHFLYFFQNFLIREHRMKLSLLGAFHFPYLTAVAVSEQSHFLGLHPHMPQHVHQHSIPINSSFCLVPLVPLSSYFDIVWWPQLSFHVHLTLTFPFLSPKPIICKPFRSSAVGSSLRMPTWQLGSLLVYPIILPGEACIHTILLLSSFKSFPVFNCPVLLFSLLSFKRFIPVPIFPILLSHLSDFAKISSDVPREYPHQQLTFPKAFCKPVTVLPLFFQLLHSTLLISSSWGANVQPQEITLWFIWHPSDKHSSTSQDCTGWVLPGSEHFPKSWFDYPEYFRVQNQILFLKCS